MADNARVDLLSESTQSSRSYSDETSSSSSILEISGNAQNQLEQQTREGDVEMTSAGQGGLFPPGDEEDPRYWVTNDPWDWPLYFYEHREDVFTNVYTHEGGTKENLLKI